MNETQIDQSNQNTVLFISEDGVGKTYLKNTPSLLVIWKQLAVEFINRQSSITNESSNMGMDRFSTGVELTLYGRNGWIFSMMNSRRMKDKRGNPQIRFIVRRERVSTMHSLNAEREVL